MRPKRFSSSQLRIDRCSASSRSSFMHCETDARDARVFQPPGRFCALSDLGKSVAARKPTRACSRAARPHGAARCVPTMPRRRHDGATTSAQSQSARARRLVIVCPGWTSTFPDDQREHAGRSSQTNQALSSIEESSRERGSRHRYDDASKNGWNVVCDLGDGHRRPGRIEMPYGACGPLISV